MSSTASSTAACLVFGPLTFATTFPAHLYEVRPTLTSASTQPSFGMSAVGVYSRILMHTCIFKSHFSVILIKYLCIFKSNFSVILVKYLPKLDQPSPWSKGRFEGCDV
jgi:hypothetical protein